MNDAAFLIYFALKFYAGSLLLSVSAFAILFAVALRSFRVALWSTAALSVAVNGWIAAFVLLRM